MKMVTFSNAETEVICGALVDGEIDFPTDCLVDNTFPVEVLSKIRRVELINSRLDNLEFLTFLPNLEELVITNLDYQKVADYLDYSESAFNIIHDYSAISRLKGLKKLVIDNDVCVRELDLGNLTELRALQLSNNPKLRSLKGMGNLHKLDTVLMYGNSIREFEGFEDCLHNTIDARINTVDIDVLFTHIKSINDLNVLYNQYVRGLTNINFSEKNGQVGHIDMEIPLFVELYKKIYTSFKRAKLFETGVTKEQQIDYIYKFVTSYVKFAEDELIQRERLYVDEVRPRYGRIPSFYDRHFGSLHGSYYAYHFRNANCEGMVNLMRFMSNIFGIESEDVHCSDKRSYNTGLNHAIYRTMYNGVWCYYDPAYRVNARGKDKKNSIGNFGRLSYDDVATYLNLSKFEKDLAYRSYSEKIIKLLDEFNHTYDSDKLHDFLDWLYSENLLREPIESLIENNFDEDLGKLLLKNKKERVKPIV